MQRIAVVGPGAIGGIVAAWLTQNDNHDVTICVRSALDRLEVSTSSGILIAQPRVVFDEAAVAPVDWVIVTTKAYDLAGTCRWLENLVGPVTRVAILQNGVEHVERFAGSVDRTRIVPVIVDIPAERTAPGRMIQRRDGTMVVARNADGEEFASLFSHSPIRVSLTDDLKSAAWKKLCLNCAGAVSALVMKPSGIVHRVDIADIMRALVLECIAVGRSQGADLPDTVVDDVIEALRSSAPDSMNSMLADRIHNRPIELDARNGVIVRLGEVGGIPTPMNRLMMALLECAVS